MKRHSYREQDIAFGQIILTLRTALKLTQTGLAAILGVSRISVADWEAGNKYPKSDNLRALIAYAVEHRAFPIGREAEEIRALWKAAHQKVRIDEPWLATLLGTSGADSPPLASRSVEGVRPAENRIPPLRPPSPTTQFIGRSAELSEIARILSEPSCRLLTLLGPGGVGKTRLALAVAAGQAQQFRDGAAYVPLETVNTASQVIYTIGNALSFSFTGQIDPTAALMRFLREQNLLLILDNFEHLLESCDLIYNLLQNAPHITVLVTSQVRLNLQAEWLFDVVGLAVPSAEPSSTDVSLSPQDMISSAAVQLFIQRAMQVQPTFAPSESVLASIVHICQQVSGNPLAIELAAAGVRNLSVAEIERQIRLNVDLLSTTFRDIPLRHRSLRAAFDYSWALLNESEQSLISRLAVFRGGCMAEAVHAITGAAFSLLRSLVDRSLLQQNDVQDISAVQRFFLLEPTREYALEKLEAAGEVDRLRHEHVVYYLELAEAITAQWDSRGQDSGLKQFGPGA